MRKTKMTRERHVEIGESLKLVQAHVADLVSEISNAAPKAGGAYKAARDAERAILVMRSELENLMFREYEQQVGDVTVYFGKSVAKTTTDVA